MADTGDKVIRVYSDFRGIDLRGEECALNRSPDALNVWRDYRELSGIKTRPALKKYAKVAEEDEYDTSISAISWDTPKDGGEDVLHVLTKDGRLFWTSKGGDVSGGHLVVGENGTLFSFQGYIYVKGAEGYWNAHDGMKVDGVVPVTSIGSLPDGTGRKTHQDVNMLTPYRINTFRADGEHDKFYLDAQDIDYGEIPSVEINGKNPFEGKEVVKTETWEDGIGYHYSEEFYDYLYVDYKEGWVQIRTNDKAPAKAEGASDNVSIKFKKTVRQAEARQDDNRFPF